MSVQRARSMQNGRPCTTSIRMREAISAAAKVEFSLVYADSILRILHFFVDLLKR